MNFLLVDLITVYIVLLYVTDKLNTGMQNYKNIATEFRKIALLVIPKVCIALWNCNTENFSVADKRLYSTNFLKTVTLEEFENLQSAHLRQVRILYLSF